ncbi:hypothetical protein OsccyDRAFT_2981 [Leptolyngbyaceae cyanobacterium JSC-12]|nr:hypothetical protein OsccyDRAFT_2981 [Leptolyngbyaceae cyanobacterium JSC-12]
MQDHQHSYRHSEEPTSFPRKKRLGGYLVEAGLLTPAQVDVALNDQKMTGMRFGEILAARGWVKQQTIEYLMQKVILPEQESMRNQQESHERDAKLVRNKQVEESPMLQDNELAPIEQSLHRELPNSKPVPSVTSSEDEVSWVG